MTKRLLILTDAPAKPLYSPRIRYLVKYLTAWGWDCMVVSESTDDGFTFEYCRHLKINFYSSGSKLKNAAVWTSDKLFGYRERMLYRYVCGHLQAADFDCILCSTFNTFPLTAAAHLSQEWHLPLVADIRDMAEQWGTDSYMRHRLPQWTGFIGHSLAHAYENRQTRLRNLALRQAKTVTTVSPWHQKQLSEYNKDVRLIYNGFDENDFAPEDITTGTFVISYTGRIYNLSFRSPHLLFEALRMLKDAGRLPEELQLKFYIEPELHAPLQSLADSFGIGSLLQISGFVSNKQTIDILHSSSVCLILTNKPEKGGAKGVMTTKFFETLGVEKPVLCVRSDEDCLADAISLTNAGLAATTKEEAAGFILDKYNEWKTNGFTRQAVRQDTKRLFTRRYQAKQFENLLLEN